MDYEPKSQPETLKAAVEALGLDYKAEFVPWSKSRNAKKPPVKPGDYSLNWKVTITAKNGRAITTDYMQGIAHIPGYKQARMTVDEFEALKYACEQGNTARLSNFGTPLGPKPIPAPALHDVMYSLLMDAEAIDVGSFEEWASNFGYGTDSREAERLYKACMDTALKLRAMLGDSTITALRESAQDY